VEYAQGVPPPRLHLLRSFGVLSSHSALRREVVPAHPCDQAQRRPLAARGDQLSLPTLGGDVDPNDDRPSPRNRWAWLLAHVFRADLDTCPRCGGPMRWVEVALTLPSIARLLAEHGVGPRPPSPRAPTFFVPALSTVRALTLSPSRMTARSTRRASAKPRSLHPFQSPNRLAHKFRRPFLLGSKPPPFLLAKRRPPHSVSLADFTTSIALGPRFGSISATEIGVPIIHL